MTSLVIYAQCEQKIGLQYARKVYLITASERTELLNCTKGT